MFNKILKQNKSKLEQEISQKQHELSLINLKIEENKSILQYIKDSISMKQQVVNQINCDIEHFQSELNKYQGIITMEDLGIEYTPEFNNINDTLTKKVEIQEKIGYLIGNSQVIITTRSYRIDGSESKGNKFQKAFCENLLIGFNAYLNKKKKSVTTKNLNQTKDLIKKKFQSINSKAELMGTSINEEYLNLCLKLTQIELDEKILKEEEREKIKEERRRLKEQEKLLLEAEKEKKKLEESKKAMNLAYSRALTDEEREDILNHIQEIDKRIGDIDYRVSNPKAGWLYIIESPSLPGMVKIGVSRRLSGPYERVKELSGSSLPEAFRINGFCFSDDAFALENNMHKYFAKQRVNPNKEFFYITPQEAIKVLKEEFRCNVHFVNEEESEEERCD